MGTKFYSQARARFNFLNFVKRLVISTFAVSLFFVLTQDIQIFPGIIRGFLGSKGEVPAGIEEFSLTTSDQERILVWKKESPFPRRREVFLFFHGNAESLSTSVPLQAFLASHGYSSYVIEYRGYPGTTGYPSEAGIYRDGEASIEFLLIKERVTPGEVVVVGNSIGTGPAAFIAQKFKVKALVLIAPYTSLRALVEQMPVIGYLAPFLKYNFPSDKYVSLLSKTCVVAVHGKRDGTIPYMHSLTLKDAYRGTGSFTLLSSDKAGHNDIFREMKGEILRSSCLCK